MTSPPLEPAAIGSASGTRPHPWFASRPVQYAALALVTLIALGLRLYKLGEWSFWIDEIFFVRRSFAFDSFPELLARLEPLSVLLTRVALNSFGTSEWSARLVPAVLGTISAPLLYFPFRHMLGTRVALIAVLLLAVSPWHLTWSQNARFYTAVMLLYTLASLAFYFAIEKDRSWYVALFWVFLLMAIRERFVAVLLIPVVVSYLLALRLLPVERPRGFGWRPVLGLGTVALAIALADVYGASTRGYSEIIGGLTLQSDQEAVMDPFRLATYIVFDIGPPLFALSVCAGAYGLAQRNRAALFLVLNAGIPFLGLLCLNVVYFTNARYALVTLPSWILLGAFAIDQLAAQTRGRTQLLAAGVLCAVLADTAASNLLYYCQNHGNRLDWRGAFSTARAMSRDGDVFVAWWPEFGPYYLGKPVTAWPGLTPAAVESTGHRHWFVLDSETIWSNSTMRSWVLENAELIDVREVRTQGGDNLILGITADLRVYLYDPARVQISSR